MDPSDSSQNRRKIPAVSDVVEELSRRLLASPEQQPALFHAAQQVCSEELRLVRTGFHPAPFEELVERAIRLLPSAIGRDAFLEPEPFAEDAGSVAAPGPPEREPSAFESHESFEPPPVEAPAAAAASIRPLEIPKESPSAFPPVITPYPRPTREPRAARRSSSSSATRIVIFLAIVGIGSAGYWLARTRRWPRPSKPVAPAASRKPPERIATPIPAAPVAPAPPASTSQSRPAAAAVEREETPVPAPAVPDSSLALPESRGSSMVSGDWDGQASVYMIHFSSYQKRENAERDAARLAKLLGRPFHVISVNLGREGSWFRVMLGDFSSREEALAFRQQLADRNTPGMGFVYKVAGLR